MKQRALPVRDPLTAAEQSLYQSILRAVPIVGDLPDRGWLVATATALGLELDGTLSRLAKRDLLGYDGATGALTYVYPFSGTSTPHRVAVAGCRPVYAMCAIDALGIPFMLDQDATITSVDPATGEPVRVDVRARQVTWDPPSTVVFACQREDEGTAAQRRCPHINFFRSAALAAAHARAHPDQQGRVLSQEEAVESSRRQFGSLLKQQSPDSCRG